MAVPVVTCGTDQSLAFAGLPHTVNLTASATDTPTAWEWRLLSVPPGSSADVGTNGDFTNGVASVQNPTFQTDVGGDYVLQARAYNATGWSFPSLDESSAQTIVSVDTANGNRIPGALTYGASWGTKMQAAVHAIEAQAYAAFSSPLTTKGDLLSYSTVAARLGVGTDGQVLTADSAEALGIKWAAATGGGGGGGGFDREEVFTAAPTAGLDSFTLSASVAANVNHPSGYSCRVFVNGVKHKPVASGTAPSGREYRLTAVAVVQVAGLVLGDEVEIVYGV